MRHEKLPIGKARKYDSTENAELDKIQKAKAIVDKKEEGYVPLTIKKGLVILVPKEKCNEKYRQAYLKKINATITEIQLT